MERSQTHFNLSFEVFPPKTSQGKTNLLKCIANLNVFNPAFYSVTFGALSSDCDGTQKIVELLCEETTIQIAPHLSCAEEKLRILDLLETYQQLNIKRLVILRGDHEVKQPQLNFACDLVMLVRKFWGESLFIEVAAYPEVHPQAKSVDADILNLKRKVEAGANGAITQFFFNADAYFYYVESCTEAGITIPIVPGIMPFFDFGKLKAFAMQCGAEIPRWILQRIDNYQHDAESLNQFGIEVITHLCETLISFGAPGLHFYTLNRSDLSAQILKNLKLHEKSARLKLVEV